jgi:triosephosphate isomerase
MIIAANFKTNHTRVSTKKYIDSLSGFLNQNSINDEIIVFPTATSLDIFEAKNIIIGTQNAYPVANGSFTGELGVEQLEEFDIKTVLIGHSERRHILKEHQELIKQKYDFYKSKDYKIIYCIGEPIEIRELGVKNTLNYLMEQLDGIDIDYENLIIAYEPVWAIGTGKVASISDIKEIHEILKSKTKAPLLYGGSVKPNNAKEILSIDSVDGVLVGSASLLVEDFCKIIKPS